MIDVTRQACFATLMVETLRALDVLGSPTAAARADEMERDLAASGRALVAASQAAASGNVIAGAPRTSDIEWIKIMTTHSTLESWSEWRCHAIIARQPADDLRPCWDATARAWRWGSPACDPRGCAWPRPWVGGEVWRG